LNLNAPMLKAKEVRQALNLAIDRPALVKSALSGYGVPSSVPLPSHHWALGDSNVQFPFDPSQAAQMLRPHTNGKALRFTCLVSADALDERIALEVKRQLASVGVDMNVEEASRDEMVRRASSGQYEAALLELISGPTVIRPYIVWHSQAPFNY